MGLFDRIFGNQQRSASPADAGQAWGSGSTDDQAIARYRYLVRTAPPEAIEQAHAEAFARLSPEQRRRVLDELSNEVPAGERDAVLRAGETPASLARVATRAELQRPGAMERAFGRVGTAGGGGMGFGGVLAGSFLGAMAGSVLGTAIASSFLEHHTGAEGAFDAPGHDVADASAGDAEGFDSFGGDFGGDSFDV
jgi:hypothetical protein